MRAFLLIVMLCVSVLIPQHADAQSRFQITEPKKISSPKKLKGNFGALRLSTRAQFQGTKTLFIYFVKLNEDGSDSDQLLRFERGAGVPIMGSNMIDPKPMVFRVAPGKYRPLAFTMACEGVPSLGSVCSFGFSGSGGFPTGRYTQSSPIIEVRAGHLTEAGDFISEYSGVIEAGKDVREIKKTGLDFDLRWKPLPLDTNNIFSSLPVIRTTEIMTKFKSRITCEERPKGVLLYFPFAC